MRSVAPRTGAPEVTIAEDQHQYKTLVGAQYDDPPAMLTRWRLDDADRERVAAGEDIYLAVLTFGGPFPPLSIQVGPEGWEPIGGCAE